MVLLCQRWDISEGQLCPYSCWSFWISSTSRWKVLDFWYICLVYITEFWLMDYHRPRERMTQLTNGNQEQIKHVVWSWPMFYLVKVVVLRVSEFGKKEGAVIWAGPPKGKPSPWSNSQKESLMSASWLFPCWEVKAVTLLQTEIELCIMSFTVDKFCKRIHIFWIIDSQCHYHRVEPHFRVWGRWCFAYAAFVNLLFSVK